MRAQERRRACILRRNDYYDPMVQREAEALVGAGFEVEVLCLHAAGAPRHAIVSGVHVIRLPVGGRSSSRTRKLAGYVGFFLLAAGRLSVEHLRRPYAVVQANSMPDFLVFAALVPKVLGSRVVAYLQEPTPELAETVLRRKWLTTLLICIEQRAIRFADHTVTVTDQLRERLISRGAQADRISVVLNCVDPESMLANWAAPPRRDRPGFVLVCHGSIEDRYGQDTIIEAARLLREEMPDLRVVMTGRGSGIDSMVRMISDYGLAEIVHFEGWVSRARLNEILYSADAGIVAQKASPYSHLVHTNKMVDYWIFGLPVIGSRLQAVSDTYDGRFIEYFEPGNAAALAAAIRRLRADPRRRAELAANGRIAQQMNGWATQRAAYLRVFDALLGNVIAGPPVGPAAVSMCQAGPARPAGAACPPGAACPAGTSHARPAEGIPAAAADPPG